jgi:diguanylate cyclase
MGGRNNLAQVAQMANRVTNEQSMFDRVRDFLTRNALGPDPVNYEFGYRVASNPDSELARTVDELTDGGIRLTRTDIEMLGGAVAIGSAATSESQREAIGQVLVAQTQMQVEGFQDLVANIRSEARDFGRDLAAKANAMRDISPSVSVSDIVRLTSAMLERVQSTEEQLEAATREADELRRKLEEARDNAQRDPLTGLANRRAYEEAFAERAARGAKIGVAVCDIDHFKRVNDGFGHAVGDRVLKAIAKTLCERCAGQLVARYGGEEFVVLFADMTLDAAHLMLETAREEVSRKRYRLRETDVPLGEVTFSAGLTMAVAGEAASDVFVRADRLLYAAKADGRNCLKIG